MGKRIQTEEPASFGQRLGELRRAAGFTQVELATELGVSQRMMGYYESPTAACGADCRPSRSWMWRRSGKCYSCRVPSSSAASARCPPPPPVDDVF